MNIQAPMLSFLRGLLTFLVFAGGAMTQVSRGGWPAHRADSQRTNFGEQEILASAWKPAWYQPVLSPPTPAWPAPAKASLWQKLSHLEPRVIDDVGDVPLIACDADGIEHVVVTSSANDRLIAVSPSTGAVQWQYVTRAPIRYAPSIVEGIAYLGSDDGEVRAIDLSDGAELWSVRLGPEMPAVIGNNRLISTHPIRTSVLADSQFVYASAGLFPNQGVYLVALDRGTGEVHWRRKTTRSPQGYLLASNDNRIYVPTGRSTPFAIRRDTGEFVVDLPSPGGSFCMLTHELFFSGPGNDAIIQTKPSPADDKMLTFAGRLIVAGANRIWSADGKQLTCVNAASMAAGELTPQWSVDCTLGGAMIGAGTTENPFLFIAQDTTIEVRDGNDGQVLHELSLPNAEDAVKHLAVSSAGPDTPEILVATGRTGAIYAWVGTKAGVREAHSSWPAEQTETAQQSTATPQSDQRVRSVLDQLPVTRGWALLLGDDRGEIACSLLNQSKLNIVSLVDDPLSATHLRSQFQDQGTYGHRISVWLQAENTPLPISPGLFNVVIEATSSQRGDDELIAMLTDKIGVLSRFQQSELKIKPALPDAGAWRHQYANSTNQADSRDPYVGAANAFRLQWFGGVGPSRMPDRHLRGPAPLSAGAVLVMQGDGILIGVDPANGTERWQRELPDGAMRYVTPFDAGYATLSEDGELLIVAAGSELWHINAYTGELINEANPPRADNKRVWGYVAQIGESIYATQMKPTAPRTASDIPTRYTFVNNDYNSERPLVTARAIEKRDHANQQQWSYASPGVVAHSSLAVDPEQQRMIFIEGRSDACVDHETDRIPMSLIMQDAWLVCLNTETGAVHWETSVVWPNAQNMIFGQLAGDRVVLTTSESENTESSNDSARYAIRVLSLHDGNEIWQAKHRHVRSGLFHGEQVHHPVVLTQPDGTELLVAEPYLYDLQDGRRVVPTGAAKDWALIRPGHSCGTLTGTGNHLFFRASYPTVLDLSQTGGKAFTALAPNRAGCWINMIPAGGRLLIPEASASCVCNYSIQTSMAFAPISAAERESALPTLEEVSVTDR